MASKIPIYGELECRTAENIIADAEQIKYDDTKNVKAKIEELENNGGGGGGNTVMDNTTLYSLTNIALQKLDTYKKLSINANKHKALYVVDDNASGTAVRPIGSAGRGLLLGTLDSSGENFTPLNDQYTYDNNDDSFTYGFYLPCIIQCTKNGPSHWVYTVISAANVNDSRVVCHRIKCAVNVELPVIVGAYIHTNNSIIDLAGVSNLRMKLLTKSNLFEFEVATVVGLNSTVSQSDIEVDNDKNALTAYIHMSPNNTNGVSGSFSLRIKNYSGTTIVVNRCYITATFNNPSGSLPQSNDKPIEFTYTKYTPSEENYYKFLEVKFESNSNWNTDDGVDVQVRVYYTESEV